MDIICRSIITNSCQKHKRMPGISFESPGLEQDMIAWINKLGNFTDREILSSGRLTQKTKPVFGTGPKKLLTSVLKCFMSLTVVSKIFSNLIIFYLKLFDCKPLSPVTPLLYIFNSQQVLYNLFAGQHLVFCKLFLCCASF